MWDGSNSQMGLRIGGWVGLDWVGLVGGESPVNNDTMLQQL